MNMDSLISTVISNITSGHKADNSDIGRLNIQDFISQGINAKTGQILLLNINSNGSMLVTDTSGNQLVANLDIFSIDKNIKLNESTAIEVKIGQVQNNVAKVHILNIDGLDVPSYLKSQQLNPSTQSIQETVIKDISNPQHLPLKNINLAEISQSIVENISLPQLQKEQLQSILQQIDIKVQINNLEPTSQHTIPNTENSIIYTQLEDSIKQIAQMMQNQSYTIQDIKGFLLNQLNSLVDKTFPAIMTSNGFSTEIGNVVIEIPIQIPEGVEAELIIKDILLQNHQEIYKSSSPIEKLMQCIQQLQNENTEIHQLITTKLPSDNEKMLANMLAFSKAASKGDIKLWLGDEIVQKLENEGSLGRTILNDLQNALQSSTRNTPQWRVIEIPYYIENQMEKIKLSIKQYPDEDEEESPHKKFGTRFVVDTNFTQLGAFQFDGFSFSKNRRFDLIIRTENNITDDLYTNIIKIFRATLSEVDYSGNIKINLKENFIKINENTNNDVFLTRDLFI